MLNRLRHQGVPKQQTSKQYMSKSKSQEKSKYAENLIEIKISKYVTHYESSSVRGIQGIKCLH